MAGRCNKFRGTRPGQVEAQVQFPVATKELHLSYYHEIVTSNDVFFWNMVS